MFYSISSTQKGLSGIDLGTFLIKQACPDYLPLLLFAGPPVDKVLFSSGQHQNLTSCSYLAALQASRAPLHWQQVAQVLLVEFPSLEQLVTLSPIPGFRRWLESQVQREARQHSSQVTPQIHPSRPSSQGVSAKLGSSMPEILPMCTW